MLFFLNHFTVDVYAVNHLHQAPSLTKISQLVNPTCPARTQGKRGRNSIDILM